MKTINFDLPVNYIKMFCVRKFSWNLLHKFKPASVNVYASDCAEIKYCNL